MPKTIGKPCDWCGTPFDSWSRRARFCSYICRNSAGGVAAGRARGRSFERWVREFWLKVKVGDPADCWPWLAGTVKGGYGSFVVKGAAKSGAHRIALSLAGGFCLPDRQACHTCDNPVCCNPHHLFWGTNIENNADCVRKGRHSHGSLSAKAVLDEQKVAEIKRRIRLGESLSTIARCFGVTRQGIEKISLGVNWRHVA